MINSYPSIYNLGHAAIADLLKQPVIVEEKIDGSQISFSKDEQGELFVRSKGAPINLAAPEGMFKRGVEFIQSIADKLRPGHTYRGEYLNTPSHNCLVYNRTPANHIIIFDVNPGLEQYTSPEEKKWAAAELGLECVPVLFGGMIETADQLRALLDTESVLGGQKIEGMVIKPADYSLFGRDKKCLMAKFVSEAFREIHSKTWDREHKTPGQTDIIVNLAGAYSTPARWQKAVIHLKEAGQIQDSPQDIGLLMKEAPADVLKECEDAIKQQLFDWAWPQLRRKICYGLPEWYRELLLKKQFETPATPSNQ